MTRRSAIAELFFFAGDDSEGREKLKVRRGKVARMKVEGKGN